MKKLIVLTFLSASLFSCKKEEIKPTYEIGMEYGGGVITDIIDEFNSTPDPNNPNAYSYEYKSTLIKIALLTDKTIIPTWVDTSNAAGCNQTWSNEEYWFSSAWAVHYCENLVSNGYDDWELMGPNDFGWGYADGSGVQFSPKFNPNNYTTNALWLYDPIIKQGEFYCTAGNTLYYDTSSWYSTTIKDSSFKANVIPIRFETVKRY